MKKADEEKMERELEAVRKKIMARLILTTIFHVFSSDGNAL